MDFFFKFIHINNWYGEEKDRGGRLFENEACCFHSGQDKVFQIFGQLAHG